MDKIKCPNCAHEFDVEEALSGKLEAHFKAEYERKVSEQADIFNAKQDLPLPLRCISYCITLHLLFNSATFLDWTPFTSCMFSQASFVKCFVGACTAGIISDFIMSELFVLLQITWLLGAIITHPAWVPDI